LSVLSIVSVTSARRAGPSGGAGEDDVFHLAAAQRLGALLAEHPGDGVDDVALARAVGSDHRGDTRLEAQGGGRGEGLESFERQRLEVHESPGSANWPPAVGDSAGNPIVAENLACRQISVPQAGPDAPQAARSAAKPATGWSGQRRFGVLSQTMQLEVERGIQLLRGGCPQLGDLVLEFQYATT